MKKPVTGNVLRARLRKAFNDEVRLSTGDNILLPDGRTVEYIQTNTAGIYPCVNVHYRVADNGNSAKQVPQRVYVGSKAYPVNFVPYKEPEMTRRDWQ